MLVKSNISWKVIAVILAAVILLLASGRLSSQIVAESGDAIGEQSGLTDMSFFAGEDIAIKVGSSDDVFAAGGTVSVDSTSADHLITAGGEITAKSINVKDVFAAGGTVDVQSGTISDDIVAAGGEVTIRPLVTIGGSAVVSGSEVKILAPVGAELKSAASRLYLNSAVTGDAKLMGDNVELGPKARIGGDLQYRAKTIKISPDAVIEGEKSLLPEEEYSEYERWGKGGLAAFAAFALIFAISLALLVIAIAFFLPSLMTSAAAMMREKPLKTLLIGLLITVLLPFAIFLLAASVVGIPIALMIAAIFLAAVPIAIAASAYFAGMLGRRKIAKKSDDTPAISERLLWPVAAVVAFILLGAIPFVGGLFWLLVLMFGMGAVVVRGGTALAQKA